MWNEPNQLKLGVILSYISMGIQSVISLIYTPVMLRLLGQSEFGVYNLVYSVISYLGLLNFGFNSAYIRFYSRYKIKKETESIARLNGMFLSLFIVLGIMAFIAGNLLAGNVSFLFSANLTDSELQTAKILMYFMSFNIAISLPTSVFDSIIIAKEQYVFQRMLYILRTALHPFLTLPLLLMGYKSISLVVVTTILSLLSLITNLWFCIKVLNVSFEFNNFDIKLLKEIWMFSFYIFINLLIDQINWNIDKFILGKTSGSIAVATYSIGAQFNSMYLSFSTAISSVFIPRVNLMVEQENSNNNLSNLFVKVGRIQFLVLGLILTGFIFFGIPFIYYYAGKGYRQSYYIALVLMVSATIPLIQNLGIEVQKAKNLHKFRSFLYLGIAIINTIISIPLSKRYGAVGPAIGTAIALLLGNGLIINIYYHKKIGIDMKEFWNEIFYITPALIIPLLSGFLLIRFVNLYSVVSLVFSIVAFSLIYITSIWFLGLNLYEKDLSMRLITKIKIKFKK